MKLFLKEITRVPVGLAQSIVTDCYRYEDETGEIIVQFKGGKKPWTMDVGLATNEVGQRYVHAASVAFVKACIQVMFQSEEEFKKAISEIEVVL
jgi:hypothetical protein